MHDDQRVRGAAAARSDGGAQVQDHQFGRVLDGRYLIGTRIARGGMASVYEAVDTRLDRTVAVKIMHAGLGDAGADDAFARRFVREAKAAARLSHPHVVAVHDQGRDDTDGHTVYLVMEHIPGHTLRDTITREAPMSPERALALLDPVISALGAAHRAGLVHRDVKPENVLIADDGRIKVADFGLAKAVSAETQHTATNGVLIGTVSYLAPELVVEQRADARADVYAVGVILFELLTGQKPHTGETPIAVAYKHVHDDIPAPSTRVPGLPAYVDALVLRATTRDASLRPTDATVLLHHVRRVAQALRDGVTEDADLVDDLLPPSRMVIDHDANGTSVRVRPQAAPVAGAAAWSGATSAADETESTWFFDSAPVAASVAAPAGAPPPPPPPATTSTTPATPTTPTTQAAAVAPAPAGRRAERRPDRRAESRPGRLSPATSVDGAGPAGSRHDERPPRRRRRLAWLLVVVLLVAAIGGAWWYGWGRYDATPGVIGLTQAAATTELEDAGFEVEVGEEVHSETVPAGEVIATDPRPGANVLPEGTVRLTVSLGPERYAVPDLSNLTVEEAEASLAEVQLVPGRTTEKFSETVEAGRVISSTPAFGTPEAASLRPGTAVALTVSKGRQPVKVGNWVGKDADTAASRLSERGLTTKVTEEVHSDTVEEGRVISQTPESGTLFKGDTVEFVVSKGPELVAVPSVRYDSTEDAVAALEKLGFVVKQERASIYLSGSVAWDTDPEAGTRLAKGSTVVLYIV